MINNFSLKKPSISINKLILLSVFYILLVDNQTLWSSLIDILDLSSVKHLLFFVAFFLLLATLLIIVFSVLAQRYMAKPAMIIIVISSATISYYIDNYNIVISPSMIQNIVETNYNEAYDLVTAKMLFHVFLFGIIPSICVGYVNIKYNSLKKELFSRITLLLVSFIIASSFVFVTYKDFAYVIRENRELRYFINPIYPIASLYKLSKKTLTDNEAALNTVFEDAKPKGTYNNVSRQKHSLLILVVGETARAASFHLNGYSRNTTPGLEKENIINFNNTYSCGTSTAESVPCMFSIYTHENFDSNKVRHTENLMDAIQHAGLDTLWLDNDGGCKGVCNRVPAKIFHTEDSADLCKNETCYDEILLSNLENHIRDLQHDALIVLHLQGSHGPAYYKRYPDKFEAFKPVCKTRDVQDCTQEEIINSYDNTILYTDYILSEVVNFLKEKSDIYNSSMLYISDHGESLGENGAYLHGLPYFMAPDEQIHIPFIAWFSENTAAENNIDISCLQQHSMRRYSHDNLIHSVLGLMNISTEQYNKDLDIFNQCRSSNNQNVIKQAGTSIKHFNHT